MKKATRKAVVAHTKSMQLRNAMIAELVTLGFKEDQEWNDRHRSDKYYQYIYLSTLGVIAIHNHDCSSSTPHLYELPSQWDTFIEEAKKEEKEKGYEVGDWVTVINRKADSMNQVGEAYQIASIKNGKVRVVEEVIYNLSSKDTFGYWECNESIRPATEEEIADAKLRADIMIGGYRMSTDKKKKTISFGCQTFTKEQVKGLFQLVDGPAKAKVVIRDVEVTPEMLSKMVESLK